jgi:hypothetical protein
MKDRIRKIVNVFSYIAIFIGLVLGFVAIDGKNASMELAQKRPTFRHQSLNADYVKLVVTYGINNEPVMSLVSDGGSTSTTPTNVDTNVSFTATSTDADSDDWKLLVCSTSSAPTASSSVPSCAGGAGNLWCVSSSWASSTISNTCTYTATSTNAESNAWWAWTCDYNIYDPKCATSSSQGSGDTGSPFNVNHRPTFTSISDDPDPVSPGSIVTFATATTSDADIDTATDTVKLFVCKAADATSSSCGVGGTWATTTLVASNPSATTTPIGVGAKTYYSYIFDNHGLGASANGASSTFTISNATPTVSTVLINSGSSTINLIENSTTTVTVTATVSDANGCGDIGTTTLKFYRSEKGDACSADENDCYSSTCSQNGGSCSGSTDTDATYTCLADLWYYADPTDTGDYEAQNWVAKVTSQDVATASHSASSTIEVNSLLAMDVAGSIAYGVLGLGATSDQATSTITNTGNTEIETNVYGADMTCESGSIGVGSQEYSTTAGFNYGSGTDLTTGSSTASVDLPQRATSTISDYIYWKLQAPATAVGGLCTGVNTFFARVGLFNQGLACSINGECASGFCTDGYCCDNACGDVCKACGILGSEGTCTNVAAGKVFADGNEIDASTSTNSCDLSYDYWGSLGSCSYNTRYAECDGSGTCDSDSSTNFTNATTSVTINKVITAAVSGGTSIPTIADASTSTNSCDLSYDYWGALGSCSYNTRYAECDGSGTCDSDSSTNFTNATTSVTINKVITAAVSGGTSIPTIADASTSTNSCDLSYDYWGALGSCSYNTRYAECDGSGTCDSDSSTNFTNATTSVTINKVITAAVSGGTSIPTIADASTSTNSCDLSYDYYASAGSCTYMKRYAECDGSGTCDSDSSTNYTTSATTSVTINKVITAAATGGTSTPTIGDASSASNSCDLSYDYWGALGSCSYNTRYAECDGSGTCDSDSSTNFTNATTSVTINKVITAAVSGGTSIPTIADASTSTNSCDLSYDYYASAGSCTYMKRYAECDGSGTCDSDASDQYASSTVNTSDTYITTTQSGGTSTPQVSGACATCKHCESGSCTNESSSEDLYSECAQQTGDAAGCRSNNCNGSGACGYQTSDYGGCTSTCHGCVGASSEACVHYTGWGEYTGCTALCTGCSAGACTNITSGSQDTYGSTTCTAAHYRCDGSGACTAPTTGVCVIPVPSEYRCDVVCGASYGYLGCIRSYEYANNCTGGLGVNCYDVYPSCLCTGYVY